MITGAFTGGFVDIHDKNIREQVAGRMAQGYAFGGTITDLVTAGLLQPECQRIFRLHYRSAGDLDRGGLRLRTQLAPR